MRKPEHSKRPGAVRTQPTPPAVSHHQSTDRDTGNLPDDSDYEFCKKHGMMTVASQQRNASMLDRQDAKRNNQSWFKISGALTGD